MDQPGVQAYVKLFRTVQEGGGANYPIFQGSRFVQNGGGFGDFLRRAFGVVFPLLMQGVGAFAGNTMRAREGGADWKSSMKSAILPTATTVLQKTAEQVERAQAGGGKHRKRRKGVKSYKKAKKMPKTEFTNWNF